MLNFAEQTGSGAVIVVWSFLSKLPFTTYIICTNHRHAANYSLLLSSHTRTPNRHPFTNKQTFQHQALYYITSLCSGPCCHMPCCSINATKKVHSIQQSWAWAWAWAWAAILITNIHIFTLELFLFILLLFYKKDLQLKQHVSISYKKESHHSRIPPSLF